MNALDFALSFVRFSTSKLIPVSENILKLRIIFMLLDHALADVRIAADGGTHPIVTALRSVKCITFKHFVFL